MDAPVWIEAMGVDIGEQTLALLTAFALGAGVGICYDLLRPLRRRTGQAVRAALDVLFCVLAGCAVFLYAMGEDNGRLGIWDLAAALLGFIIYLHTLSDTMLSLFTAILDVVCKVMKACKKILKKSAVSAKIIFKKMRECFIIKK